MASHTYIHYITLYCLSAPKAVVVVFGVWFRFPFPITFFFIERNPDWTGSGRLVLSCLPETFLKCRGTTGTTGHSDGSYLTYSECSSHTHGAESKQILLFHVCAHLLKCFECTRTVVYDII